jgi:hypothetical protein
LTVPIQQVSACNFCGCSSGNYFLGPTPQFNKHFFGLRYSFRSFNTVVKNDDTQFSKDFYQTAEIWGGLKIKNKFQVLAYVPYNFNHSITDDGVKTNHDFGDIILIGSYKFLDKNSLTKDTLTVQQQLWIGAGVKFPTGHFDVDTSELVSANTQAGTGSFDFLLTSSYDITIDDWGLVSDISYKINQAASDFRFGNRFTASSIVFHSFYLTENSFSPNIGLHYENLNPNEFAKTKIENTGGYALLGSVGLETRFDKIIIGFNAELPIIENISDEQTKINCRGMAHVSFAF